MIIFDRNTKELDIPVGLGNLDVNIVTGGTTEVVSSLDGQTGALTLKTINGIALLGEGDITVVEKFIFDDMTESERVQMLALIGENPSVNDKYQFYKAYDIGEDDKRVIRLQFIYEVDGRYYFGAALADVQNDHRIINFVCILASDGGISQADYHIRTIAEKTSELTNDSGFITSAETANFMTSAQTQEAISSALTDYATTAVTETKIDKPKVATGGLSRPIYYRNGSGLTPCNITSINNSRWNSLVVDVGGNTMVGRYLVFHSGATDNSTSVQFGKGAAKAGFTVYYPATGTDYTLTTNQHFVVDSDDIVHIKKITQADYDALVSAGTVDEHTLYLIEN